MPKIQFVALGMVFVASVLALTTDPVLRSAAKWLLVFALIFGLLPFVWHPVLYGLCVWQIRK